MSFHPLVKFVLIILLGSMSFIVNAQPVACLPSIVFALLLVCIKDYTYAIGMLGISIALQFGTEMLMQNSNESLKVMAQVTEAFHKMIVMVMGASVFYKTTETTDLIKALERLKVPKQITLPLAVTLRFIPTLQVEFRAIKDAMKIRGIPLGVRGFFRHPIKQIEYMLVPLLMRSARIADELSASCITRGINSMNQKTSYKSIKVRGKDYLLILVGIVVCTGIIFVDILMK
jgi:energy-coupling factor transporter transmembrane protein EcfT